MSYLGEETTGRDVVREIELRFWHKEYFEAGVLMQTGHLARELEAYIRPLIGSPDKNESCVVSCDLVIRSALRLWCYLSFVGGDLERIRPKLGVPYDPILHEPAEEVHRKESRSNTERKVAFVLRPGFHLRENGLMGIRTMTSRALVILK